MLASRIDPVSSVALSAISCLASHVTSHVVGCSGIRNNVSPYGVWGFPSHFDRDGIYHPYNLYLYWMSALWPFSLAIAFALLEGYVGTPFHSLIGLGVPPPLGDRWFLVSMSCWDFVGTS